MVDLITITDNTPTFTENGGPTGYDFEEVQTTGNAATKLRVAGSSMLATSGTDTLATTISQSQTCAHVAVEIAQIIATLPTISAIDLTNPTTITVTFSETVQTAGAGSTSNWTISGGNTTLTIDSVSDISAGSTTVELTISNYDGGQVQLLYTSTGSDDITDSSTIANALVTTTAADVDDNIAPTIVSAVTGDTGVGLNKVTVTFSENVDVTSAAPAGWTVTGTDAGGRTVTGITDPADSSDTLVLTLSSSFSAENPDATVTYTSGSADLVDASSANNELATGASPNITDGIIPTLVSAVTGPAADEITFTFSETIASGTVEFGDFANQSSKAADAITSVSGSDVTVSYASDFATDFTAIASTEAFASLAEIEDSAGNALIQGTGDTTVAVADGLAPIFTAISLSSTTTQVDFSETVDGTLTFSEWKFDGNAATAVNSQTDGDTLNDVTTLTFTHATTTDTTPDVVYSGTTLADQAGDKLPNPTTATIGDQVAPTFTAERTALNTIVLTLMNQ